MPLPAQWWNGVIRNRHSERNERMSDPSRFPILYYVRCVTVFEVRQRIESPNGDSDYLMKTTSSLELANKECAISNQRAVKAGHPVASRPVEAIGPDTGLPRINIPSEEFGTISIEVSVEEFERLKKRGW